MGIQRLARIHAVWICVGVTACFSGTEPGVRIISGGNVRDTARAVLPAPLVVQLLDDALRPLPGMAIEFEADARGPNGPRAYVQKDTSDGLTIWVTDTTDAWGRVSVRVILGESSGETWVHARAVHSDQADSARFVVLPGALARVDVAPADTAVYVSGTLRLRGRALDQFGNERQDQLEWSGTSNVVTVDPAGLIRGVRFGRATAQVRRGAFSDSVPLSVVPAGEVAAIFRPIAAGEPPHVVVFRTNGTGFTRLDLGALFSSSTTWASADLLLLNRNVVPDVWFLQQIYITSLAGNGRTIRPGPDPLQAEYAPVMSADGWIYFAGQPGHQNRELWRVRADGSSAGRIGLAAGFYDVYDLPWPSPNGSEIVYTFWPGTGTQPELHILNTTTGADQDLGIVGTSASWSPVGDQILFARDNDYFLVAPDGSGERVLYPGGSHGRGSWSPDGRWVVLLVPDPTSSWPARVKLALVEVATGLALPLGWTSQLTDPAWRPLAP